MLEYRLEENLHLRRLGEVDLLTLCSTEIFDKVLGEPGGGGWSFTGEQVPVKLRGGHSNDVEETGFGPHQAPRVVEVYISSHESGRNLCHGVGRMAKALLELSQEYKPVSTARREAKPKGFSFYCILRHYLAGNLMLAFR